MILSSLAVISLVLHFNCILHLVVCALVSLSHDAMTWRVICDCGISRTCHLFFVGAEVCGVLSESRLSRLKPVPCNVNDVALSLNLYKPSVL